MIADARRGWWVVAALTLCLAVSACGGDDDDSVPEDAGTSSGLGEARFDAIDAVLTASLALDHIRTERDTAKVAAAARPAIRACLRLEDDDPLLSAYRRTCPLGAELASLDIDACDEEDACIRSMGKIRRLMRRAIRHSRDVDSVLAREKLSARCRDSLKTSAAEYDIYDDTGRAAALLQRAISDPSGDDLTKALSLFEDLDGGQSPSFSAKKKRERFRAGCA